LNLILLGLLSPKKLWCEKVPGIIKGKTRT